MKENAFDDAEVNATDDVEVNATKYASPPFHILKSSQDPFRPSSPGALCPSMLSARLDRLHRSTSSCHRPLLQLPNLHIASREDPHLLSLVLSFPCSDCVPGSEESPQAPVSQQASESKPRETQQALSPAQLCHPCSISTSCSGRFRWRHQRSNGARLAGTVRRYAQSLLS